MSIFGRIKDAIFGSDAEAQETPRPKPTGNAWADAPVVEPKARPMVDIESNLDNMPGADRLNWRTSIVDLMKLIGVDSDYESRKALAERFGTSRRLVRLALDALEVEGLVWRKQGSGTFAGQPSDPTGDLAARIAGETDALQVMEARLCIEPELAALCALRMTDAEVARLRMLAHRQVEATDPQGTELWDGALHRLIAHCARGLADYKVPRHVEFVNEFPLTATGKVQRNVVARMARDQALAG